MFNYYNKHLSNKLMKLSNNIIDKINNIIINNCIAKDYFNTKTLSSLLIIHKNNNNEIVNIEYNMPKLYEITNHISNNIVNKLIDIDLSHIDYVMKSNTKAKEIYLGIPSGIITDNILINNLGPRIPIKISYIGNIFTNIKTSISDYGINNTLIEVYVVIDIDNNITAPFISDDKKSSYNLLVASTVIEGKIPSIYNGHLDYESNIKMTSIK